MLSNTFHQGKPIVHLLRTGLRGQESTSLKPEDRLELGPRSLKLTR
jgi:hypothetical protein